MKFLVNLRGLARVLAVTLAVALPITLAISTADARVGGGISSGSRGSRTFSMPPSTSTSPGTAQPFNRTVTPPNAGPGYQTGGGVGGGFFNRSGRGLLGGLAA